MTSRTANPAGVGTTPQSFWRQVLSTEKWGPYGMVLLVVSELVLFSIWAPNTFPTATNFRAVIANQVILGLIVLAILVPLIAGERDASLPAVVAVTSLTAATLMANQAWPLIPSIIVALLFAAVIGFINGWIVVKVGVSSLVTTLGTFTILTGLITALAGGRTISNGLPKKALERLANPRLLGLPLPVYYLLAVAIVVWYVTERTPLGRQWQAVGSSEPAARMAGLRTDRLRILAFTAGGFLAGVAGVVQLVRSQVGSPNIGPNLLFPAFAAAFLGATAFRPGKFNVRGAMLSVALLSFGVVGLIMVGAPYWVDQLFNGGALILSLVLVRYLRRETP
jgi:ribose transport system permease protein